ncbi:MAG: glutamate-1-semialdehyde 2,1-aminomutase [Armatimonadota bacterium]
MKTYLSKKLYKKACGLMPSGVNSPVRAFKSVGGTPLYMARGKGAFLYDADGNKYMDFCSSWGPLILGHTNAKVQSAIKEAVTKGLSFGTCHPDEVEFARTVKSFFPSMQMMRLVASGTEAVMSAIRAARGFTKKNKVIKFEGCYHGHSDTLLAKSGSGLATFGIPGTAGVTEGAVKDTIILPYNDTEAFIKCFNKCWKDLAAVIIEPVAGNMGVVLPSKEFLKTIREYTKKSGSVLIFDEVITGFRVSKGGAQSYYGIKPDITCLGKIAGGGMPIGIYGGRKDIMKYIAPSGPVYQAGTLSGNPIAVAAGIAVLKQLSEKSFYKTLDKKAEYLVKKLKKVIKDKKLPVQINSIASMFTIFFNKDKITDYKSASSSDAKKYARFFNELIRKEIYFPPSQFEAAFINSAMSYEDLAYAAKIIGELLTKI